MCFQLLPLLKVTPQGKIAKRLLQGTISQIVIQITNEGEGDATSLAPIIPDDPMLTVEQFAINGANETGKSHKWVHL